MKLGALNSVLSVVLLLMLVQTAPAQTLQDRVPMITTETGQGSGWVIASLIVTARHVTRGHEVVGVAFVNREPVLADVVCESRDRDLALVRPRDGRQMNGWEIVPGCIQSPCAAFVGMRVTMFGYAGGTWTGISAYVRGRGDRVVVDGEEVGPYLDLALGTRSVGTGSTSMAGMSGGPVVAKGRVIAAITGQGVVRTRSRSGSIVTVPIGAVASTLDWEEGCSPY